MIERTHLAILREVDRRGTLTEAASSLCLTQPALSHSIKKLEQRLGVKLWSKEGRMLRLTQAGRALLSLANRILPQLEHAEILMQQYAQGSRGILRIGMECHPCYRWLLRVVSPFLQKWPGVDLDVKQAFQFGGIGALLNCDIDLLVTPDPIFKPGLIFEAVFDYELVIVVSESHPLSNESAISPAQLVDETLVTYPVEIERLDVYSQFMLPANCHPKQRKIIETTDIMLELVAAGRVITALPDWLVADYSKTLPVKSVRMGADGIHKQIYIGARAADQQIEYLESFLNMAKNLGRSFD